MDVKQTIEVLRKTNSYTCGNEIADLISRQAEQIERMRWIPCSERLPKSEIGKYGILEPKVVLCTDGKTVYRAYYVKQYEFNCEMLGHFEGDTDTNEDGDEYWPEGWYEYSGENEEVDWALGAIITHWMPLPEPPSENDRPEPPENRTEVRK